MARPAKDKNQLALLDALAKAYADETEPEVGYLARLFTQTSLPYKDPGDVPAWGRRNGTLELVVTPGYRTGETSTHERVGYPFGVYPRLLLSWMCTEAVRTQSRELELGPTLAEFMRSLHSGAAPRATGGKNGNITRLRDQMTRLFHSRLTITRYELVDGTEEEQGIKLDVIEGWKVGWVKNGASRSELAKGSLVRLSSALYEEITERPVPLDLNAMKLLSGSPMRLDIYAWLVYRLGYLRRPTTVPWDSLKAQLGTGLADTKQGMFQFKKNFEDNLRYVLMVYPDANVEIVPSGVRLLRSKPAVPRTKELRVLEAI